MAPCLSKLAEVKFELFGKRQHGRRIHGVIEPVHKIAVCNEIHAKHGGEHGQGRGSWVKSEWFECCRIFSLTGHVYFGKFTGVTTSRLGGY
jgi:hypothetical protein